MTVPLGDFDRLLQGIRRCVTAEQRALVVAALQTAVLALRRDEAGGRARWTIATLLDGSGPLGDEAKRRSATTAARPDGSVRRRAGEKVTGGGR